MRNQKHFQQFVPPLESESHRTPATANGNSAWLQYFVKAVLDSFVEPRILGIFFSTVVEVIRDSGSLAVSRERVNHDFTWLNPSVQQSRYRCKRESLAVGHSEFTGEVWHASPSFACGVSSAYPSVDTPIRYRPLHQEHPDFSCYQVLIGESFSSVKIHAQRLALE